MTTLLLLLWLIPIAGFVYRDKDGRKPNYKLEWFYRTITLFIYWFLWTKDPKDGWLIFWVSVYTMTSFWIVFEISLNVIRNIPLLYFDRLEGDSGMIDRFFAKKHVLWHAVAKVAAFALMVYSIIRIYALH